MEASDGKPIYIYKIRLGRSAAEIARSELSEIWGQGLTLERTIYPCSQKFCRGEFDLQSRDEVTKPRFKLSPPSFIQNLDCTCISLAKMCGFSEAKRRDDLQGLRGIAIIAVVLFHFFPRQFPNGHVGVDQFFVLSGFFMTMMLERAEVLRCREVVIFYYRRMKRLVPLYILVVLACVLIFKLDSSLMLRYTNDISALYASCFMTNLKAAVSVKGYRQMLSSADDLFTHTWSISLEMQFYVIFPVLFIAYKFLPGSISSIFLAIVAATSLYFHITLPTKIAFNLVEARLWQFIIGIIVHQHNGRKNEQDWYEDSFSQLPHLKAKYCMSQTLIHSLLLLIHVTISLVIFQPIPIIYLRVSSTLLTGMLMLFHPKIANGVLSSKYLTYIGNISYALYLVHWPIYIAIRRESTHTVSPYCGILIALLISAILSEFFEKGYLHANVWTVVLLVLCLYGALFVTLYRDEKMLQKERAWSAKLFEPVCTSKPQNYSEGCDIPYNNVTLTKDEAILLNELHTIDDERNLIHSKCTYEIGGPYGWCSFPAEHSKPQQRILVMGNSYATNQAGIIYEMCHAHGRSFSLFSMPACEVLHASRLTRCEASLETFKRAVKRHKPDVMFLLSRYINLMKLPGKIPDPYSPFSEQAVAQAKAILRAFEKNVRDRIFILHVLPRPLWNFMPKYVRELRNSNGSHPNIWLAPAGKARRNLEMIVKDCKKCTLIDYLPLFMSNGSFHVIDERTNVSFISGQLHFTPLGLNRLRPFYKKICEEL